MYCSRCGKELPTNSSFCPKCGTRVLTAGADPPRVVNTSSPPPDFAAPLPNTSPPSANAAAPAAKPPKKRHGCLKTGLIVTASVIATLLILAVISFIFVSRPNKYTHPALGFSFNYPHGLNINIPDAASLGQANPTGNPWFILVQDPSYQNYTVNWIITFSVAGSGSSEDEILTELDKDVAGGAAAPLTVHGIKMYRYINDPAAPSQTLTDFYKAAGMDSTKEKYAYIFIYNGTGFMIGFRQPPAGAPGNYNQYLDINSWNNPAAKNTVTPTATISGNVIAKQSIGTGGGTVSVNKPGDALDGLQVTVPAGAYAGAKTFQVAEQPAPNLNIQDVEVVTPLITVDNGGSFADQPMTLRIPIKITQDDFAMAFFYDDRTGQMEGLPLLSEDNNSLTVETCHFSKIIAVKINNKSVDNIIKDGVTTKFTPLKDNWQFVNNGSYITPAGQCAGMSVTSLWYYDQISSQGLGKPLYNLYRGKAAEIWEDDTPAYKFPAVVQKDYQSLPRGTEEAQQIGASDRLVFNAFAVSMYVTQQPQLVGVSGKVKSNNERVNHSMVAWKLTEKGLYVVDPNKPDAQGGLLIPFNNGLFGTLDDPWVSWDLFFYNAKSAITPWDKIAQRWQEFTSGSIGVKIFPDYTLVVTDANGNQYSLKDNLNVNTNTVSLQVTSQANLETAIYRDGAWIAVLDNGQPEIKRSWNNITLNQGDNVIGIYVMGDPADPKEPGFEWDDFQWVDITYGLTTTTAPTTAIKPPVTTTAPAGAADATIDTISARLIDQQGTDYYYMVTVTGTATGPVGTGFRVSVEVLAESGGYAVEDGYGSDSTQTSWTDFEADYSEYVRQNSDPASTKWTYTVPIRISAPWNGNIVVHVKVDKFTSGYAPGGLKTIKKPYTISGPP